MAIAEKVDSLDDEALLTLLSNATRLSNGTVSPRQKEALLLLPVIQAVVDARSLLTPKRSKVSRAASKPAV